MDEREPARPVADDDLVPEHGAGRREPDLLDVGAAEPARDDVDRVVRLVDLGEARPAFIV